MISKLDYLTLFFGDEGVSADTSGSDIGTNDNNSTESVTDQNKADDDGGSAKKYSDDDLDRILKKKYDKLVKKAEEEAAKKSRLENMNAQERAEQERDELRAELDALKKANARADTEKTIRGLLQENKLDVPDTIVAMLVDDDADKVKDNIKVFTKWAKDYGEAFAKTKYSHKTPSTGTSGAGLTKEAILSEPDNRKRQQLIKENLPLFTTKRR
jgi:hypothetical protein